MSLMFVTLMLAAVTLLVATCAPAHLDTLEMEPYALVRNGVLVYVYYTS